MRVCVANSVSNRRLLQMHYAELAEKMRFHKQQTKGVGTMCRIFEEYGNEIREEAKAESKIEFAEDLIRQNKLSLEDIASVAKLPLAQVQQIAARLGVRA